MKIILSPAKKLLEKPAEYDVQATQPLFQKQVASLIGELQKKSVSGLQKLMGISERLAQLNYDRYQHFTPSRYQADNAYPAIFNFQGDVYRAMDAGSLSEESLQFAQSHLIILSGLYGLLRPFDLMQDYRLEMGTRFQVGDCANLYAFWRQTLTTFFKQYLSEDANRCLINLASTEYAKAIDFKLLGDQVIHIDFKEQKDNGLKTIGILAKKARGSMARFVLQHQLIFPEALKDFNQGGYQFRHDLSDAQHWVFVADRR